MREVLYLIYGENGEEWMNEHPSKRMIVSAKEIRDALQMDEDDETLYCWIENSIVEDILDSGFSVYVEGSDSSNERWEAFARQLEAEREKSWKVNVRKDEKVTS